MTGYGETIRSRLMKNRSNIMNTFKKQNSIKTKLKSSIATISLVAVLGGCTLSPTPIQNSERWSQAVKDIHVAYQNQDPITKPITLYEAIARAIKYNLDHRVKMMEKAVALGQSEVATFDMLPQLTTKAGYHNRDKFSGGISQSLINGVQSLEDSTSQERDRTTLELTFAWNILDFGISYFRALQQANLALVAEEQRRKSIQNIIQDIRYAYWRAVSAEAVISKIDHLKKKVKHALTQSRSAEGERVESPLDALNYQRSLLDSLRQLNELRRNLAFAKTELAALMNLKPNETFELADNTDVNAPNEIEVETAIFEKVALTNRPELFEEDYRSRINSEEVRVAWMEMLPAPNINFSLQQDSNVFLFEEHWRQLTAEASLNLINLITGPTKISFARTQGELGKTRRMAMSVAILTQVHVALLRYNMALEEYKLSKKIKTVDSKIYRQLKNRQQNDAATEQQVIMAAVNELVGQTRRDASFAELQNAIGALYFSLGLDPMPRTIESHDINILTAAIEDRMGNWETMNLASLEESNNYYMPVIGEEKHDGHHYNNYLTQDGSDESGDKEKTLLTNQEDKSLKGKTLEKTSSDDASNNEVAKEEEKEEEGFFSRLFGGSSEEEATADAEKDEMSVETDEEKKDQEDQSSNNLEENDKNKEKLTHLKSNYDKNLLNTPYPESTLLNTADDVKKDTDETVKTDKKELPEDKGDKTQN